MTHEIINKSEFYRAMASHFNEQASAQRKQESKMLAVVKRIKELATEWETLMTSLYSPEESVLPMMQDQPLKRKPGRPKRIPIAIQVVEAEKTLKPTIETDGNTSPEALIADGSVKRRPGRPKKIDSQCPITITRKKH